MKAQTLEDPENILLKSTKVVTDIPTQVLPYAIQAAEVIWHSNGVAISANQIGIPYRWYVDYNEIVFINPTILEKSDLIPVAEGCLSVPGVNVIMPRYDKITLEFTDVANKRHVIKIEGLDAQIAQHELDHLNGEIISDD